VDFNCFVFLISGEEVPVMEYMNQQHKLLPQVATAYVLNTAVQYLTKKHQRFLKHASAGDLSELPEVGDWCARL